MLILRNLKKNLSRVESTLQELHFVSFSQRKKKFLSMSKSSSKKKNSKYENALDSEPFF